MERKVEHKSVSRQVEEIKALSEDILEYRSIDVQKAWLRMERRGRAASCQTNFVAAFYSCGSYIGASVVIFFVTFLLFVLCHKI